MDRVRLGRKEWHDVELPAAPGLPPTMLKPEELQLLSWLAASRADSGQGAFVDLGCWLGGSACALAEGVRRTGAGIRVHAFDRFRWRRHYMERHFAAGLADHASFRPLFDAFSKPWSRWLEVHDADFHHLRWEGGPIDLLVVDAAKSWELLSAILGGFGPALIPGRSLVVLQDYQHWSTPFLPLVFGGRPDLWEPVYWTEAGTTTVFRMRRTVLGADGLELPLRCEDFPWEVASRILGGLIDGLGGRVRARLVATFLRLAVLDDRHEDALRLRQALLSDPHARELVTQLGPIQDTLYRDLAHAAALRRSGRPVEALGLARRCRARAPEEVYTAIELIACLEAAGSQSEAFREADGLVAVAPEFAEGWLARARLHRSACRGREAREDFARALALEPRLSDAVAPWTDLDAVDPDASPP